MLDIKINHNSASRILKFNCKTFEHVISFQRMSSSFYEILNDIDYSRDIWIDLIKENTNFFGGERKFRFPYGNFLSLAYSIADLIAIGVEFHLRELLECSEIFQLIVLEKITSLEFACSMFRNALRKRYFKLAGEIAIRFDLSNFKVIPATICLDNFLVMKSVLINCPFTKEHVENCLKHSNLNALRAFLEKGFDLNTLDKLIETLLTLNGDQVFQILSIAREYGHPIDLSKGIEMPRLRRGKKLLTLADCAILMGKLNIVDALMQYKRTVF